MSNKVAGGERFMKFIGDFASDRKSKIYLFLLTSCLYICKLQLFMPRLGCSGSLHLTSGWDTQEVTRLQGEHSGHRAAARLRCRWPRT